MSVATADAEIVEDPVTRPDDNRPCRGKPRNKGRCGKPSTHLVTLHCGSCGYSASRPLCTRHALRAEALRWFCKICRNWLTHMITPL